MSTSGLVLSTVAAVDGKPGSPRSQGTDWCVTSRMVVLNRATYDSVQMSEEPAKVVICATFISCLGQLDKELYR